MRYVHESIYLDNFLTVLIQEFLLETLEKLDTLTNRLSLAETSTINGDSAHAAPKADVSAPISNNVDTRAHPHPSLGVVNPEIDAYTRTQVDDLISHAKQLVGNIQTCAEHQALITNNVLDLSRLDAGKVELSFDVVNIPALGQQTVEMMLAKARDKHINLTMAEWRSPILYLRADATVLRQVLLNLVSNAIKVSPST